MARVLVERFNVRRYVINTGPAVSLLAEGSLVCPLSECSGKVAFTTTIVRVQPLKVESGKTSDLGQPLKDYVLAELKARVVRFGSVASRDPLGGSKSCPLCGIFYGWVQPHTVELVELAKAYMDGCTVHDIPALWEEEESDFGPWNGPLKFIDPDTGVAHHCRMLDGVTATRG